jgi:dUTP pyrophosphatase
VEEQAQHRDRLRGGPTLRIKRLHPNAHLPLCATEGASGLDLFACITEGEGRILLEEKPRLVGTGIAVEVPRGYDAQVRPRSGLSTKGVMVACGTVDSDYRGEIMVTMYVLGRDNSFEIKHGDRIAQLVIGKLARLHMVVAEELTPTERGARGHGSTGVN